MERQRERRRERERERERERRKETDSDKFITFNNIEKNAIYHGTSFIFTVQNCLLLL